MAKRTERYYPVEAIDDGQFVNRLPKTTPDDCE